MTPVYHIIHGQKKGGKTMGHANAHMKRLLSAALSLAMVLQVGATAFAVGSEDLLTKVK